MPRPSRPWFRFYVEAVHDRKLRRLKPEYRWLFVACLAAARQSPEPGWLMVGENDPMGWDDLCDFAAMKQRAVEDGTDALHDAGVLARDPERKCWYIPNWNERQFESDDVSARVQRSRERRSNVANPLPGTPPETETENRDRYKNAVPSSNEEVGPQVVEDQGLDEGGIALASRRGTSVSALVLGSGDRSADAPSAALGASGGSGSSNGKGVTNG